MVLRISFNKSNAYQLQHANQWRSYTARSSVGKLAPHKRITFKLGLLIDSHSLQIVRCSFVAERWFLRPIRHTFGWIYGMVILPCCRRIKWTFLWCLCFDCLRCSSINGITVFPYNDSGCLPHPQLNFFQFNLTIRSFSHRMLEHLIK